MQTGIKLFAAIVFLFVVSHKLTSQNMNFYKTKWNQVDSLDKKGLPKSALTVVDEIYKKALKDKHSEQVLKSFIYILKYKNSIEENAFEKLCFELDSTAKTAEYPDKAIMNSMLADMYWWYYQNNRWKFMQRSNTINFDNTDMKTWTLDYLVYKIISAYTAALKEKEILQKIPISNYSELIVKGTKPEELRPTLYDFIAHKAIDFYSNSEISLTKPAEYFELKEGFYFSEADKFIQKDLKTSDSLSLHFHAQVLLQDLLSFRLLNKNQENALIDVDLKRLNFAYNHSVNPNKDKLFLEALKIIEKKYEKNPFSSEISFQIAEFYFDLSGKYNFEQPETDVYKTYKKTAYDICSNIVEKYPKSNAAEHCNALISQIKNHNLSFIIEGTIPVSQKFPVLVSCQNTNKFYVKVAKIDRDKYERLADKLYGEKLYDKLKEISVVQYQITKQIPDDGLFNSHSVELILNDLKTPGMYVLFISDNENYTYNKGQATFKTFDVSDISYVKQRNADGSYTFFVADRKTGEPMQGVSCQLWYTKYNYSLRKYLRVDKESQLTDKNGFVYFSETSRDYSNWYVDFNKANDFLTTKSPIYLYKNDLTKYTTEKTFFFSDRAIYRPGQTIFFKGIVLSSDGEKNEITTNKNGTIALYDVNNQKITETNVTTNEFGTFSGSFEIPSGLINGQFYINGFSGTHYFSVEEYKRPKFEVEMLPFKGNYLLNDDVTVEGKAISFSGAAVSEATVTYRVTRTPRWRGWWYWNIPAQTIEIASGKTFTNEDGTFKIDFKAIPDLSIPESEFTYFSYQISVDVLDLNGETQSTSGYLNVGYRALQVSLSVPQLINKQAKEIDDEEEFIYPIETINYNGEFLEASGQITIYKLKANTDLIKDKLWKSAEIQLYSKEEWDKELPHYLYNNENEITEFPKEEQVFMTFFNTKDDKKLNLSGIKSFKTGLYVAEISSKDAFGNLVSNKHFFTVFNHKDKELPAKLPDLFIPVKTDCEPGEQAMFLVGSSYQNVQLLYQIEHKNQIVSSKFINLNNEQKLISIPVEEKHRGNFSVHLMFIKENRLYNYNAVINVPHSDKKLDIEFATFRDKLLPGQKEEWKIKIKGPKGEKVSSEFLATLYDASLDQFRANYWDFDIYKSYYSNNSWSSETFLSGNSTLLVKDLDNYVSPSNLYYNRFNWFGFSYYSGYRNFDSEYDTPKFANVRTKKAEKNGRTGQLKEEEETGSVVESPVSVDVVGGKVIISGENSLAKEDFSNVKVRTNFNETAFFYPHLKTDENGDVIIAFTIPESLTKWKMMGFAVNKNLQYGFIQNELITQKDLMVVPNAPRFFRENDKMVFPVKISNVSDKDLNGQVQLEFFDAITMQPVESVIIKGETIQKSFSIKAGNNVLTTWNIIIPEGIGALSYKVVAKAGEFSDGEQKPIPVLTNRMLVTESLPLPVRGNETKNFIFKKLLDSEKSETLRHHKLTLEFTSNPAWYAVQALPYLMEYPYECTEQTFSRFYANSIASHIANSNPKIKRVFDSWKESDAGALISNLEKNEELKAVLLEETPWVLQGKDETERKKRVGLLFDLNKMADELNRALKKIQDAQSSNGAWPWFEGMPESRYITQHIVSGLGHLDKLKVNTVRQDSKTWKMLGDAVKYLDSKIEEDYDWLKKHYTKQELEKNLLNYTAIHYLYGRSYFTDIPIPASSKEAFDYYFKQSENYWLSQSKYMQAMIALYLNRYNQKLIAADIIKSLKEKSTDNQEMGMYWIDNVSGWYWYQAPIEQQALMIEVFDEVANDQKSVNDMKIWLLKQKQTQDWKTTRATTEAVYALLLRGTDWLASDKQVKIFIADKLIDPQKIDNVKVEAGTGYFKTSWSGTEIKPKMGNVTVTKEDEGVSWGALYWQYFEDLDKITPHETPLKLKKQLFIERLTERGKVIEPISDKAILNVGDKVIVRIELRVDRQMEYIHMKDMRASGFEPINVFSRYNRQDGLGYYESTKDASTNFFMETLPKGTYVFEYPLRVTHEGNFSNGITSIQCMYAPEFTSHSEGIRVDVKK